MTTLASFFLGPANLDTAVNQDTLVTSISASSNSGIEYASPMFDTESEGSCSSSQLLPPSINNVDITQHSRSVHVAFGSIRLTRESNNNSSWCIRAGDAPFLEHFPTEGISDLNRRGWLHYEHIDHRSRRDLAVARIFLLPEDVKRAERASPKPFRKVIRWLANIVDISSDTWNGKFDSDSEVDGYGIPSAAQEESLFYIFNTLDSPNLSLDGFSGTSHAQSALHETMNGTIPGIKTELYPYQRRSIATMLQREEDPNMSQDARKPKYVDLEGSEFHMDVFDGVVVRDSQLYVETRGGILAETMGYGKTLVCIALVLATRGFYPQVPEARIERVEQKLYPHTPTLLSMAARAFRHNGLPWKAEFHTLAKSGIHYDRIVGELQKHEREFGEPIFHPTTPGRKASKRESERTLRLCNATLVVVPPNLIVQWQHEIRKHTEPEALHVLVIDMSTKAIPHWRVLMKQDIVLISKNRLDSEYHDDDLNTGKRLRGTDRVSSQLTELRWLRVICDEGHSFASSTSRTRTMAMLDKLSVERRWIISGTPSSSLIGADVSLAVHNKSSAKRSKSLDKVLEQRRLPDSAKQEERDMDRLRLIVCNFLKVQPWANQKGSDQANWKKYLAPFDSDGRRRCAPGLRPLLQSIMIRHKIQDIDTDISLPPLHNRTVYLEPSHYDRLTLNLFTLVLTANAITSERVDEDYMHHSKNRKNLDLLFSNLRQSTFHWVGFTPEQVEETIKSCNTYFDKHIETISDTDGVLLTQSLSHASKTLADTGWLAFSRLHEIGVYIEGFPEAARAAWSLHGQGGDPLLLGTLQAREAQTHVRKNFCNDDPTSGLIGAGMRAMHAAHKRAEENQKPKKGSTSVAANDSSTKTPGISEEPKIKGPQSRPQTPTSRKRRHSSISKSPIKVRSPTAFAALSTPMITGFTSAKLTYLCNSILSLPSTTKSLIFYDSNNTAFWVSEALELLGIQFLIYSNTLPAPTRAKYLNMFNTEPRWRVLLMDLKQASTGLHVASASRVWIVTPIWRREVEAQAIKRAHRIGQTEEVYVETLVLKGTIEERLWRRRKGVSEAEGRKLAAGEGKNVDGAASGSTNSSSGGGKSTTSQNIGSGGWLEDDGVVEIIKSARFLDTEESDTEQAGNGKEESCRLKTPVPFFVRKEDEEQINHNTGHGEDSHGREKSMPGRKRVKFATDSPSTTSITSPEPKGVRFVGVHLPARSPFPMVASSLPPAVENMAPQQQQPPQPESIFGNLPNLG